MAPRATFPASTSQAGRLLLWLVRRNVPILAKAMRVALGSDIYCRLPNEIHLPHPYGIVIHHDVVLGEGVIVMQQVTIGQRLPTEPQVPVIEDGVYIGAGAKVFGDIRIGHDAVIGANAVVTIDVPPGARVVGFNRLLPPPGGDPSRAR